MTSYFRTEAVALAGRRPVRALSLAMGLWVASVSTYGMDTDCCAKATSPISSTGAQLGTEECEKKWGIQITAFRLSGNGNIIDFRYRVTDPEKALVLADPKAKPLLIDQDTGARLHVPSMPKVGQLRGTGEKLVAGKVYITLFTNPGKAAKKGDKLTLTVGDFRAENLVLGD